MDELLLLEESEDNLICKENDVCLHEEIITDKGKQFCVECGEQIGQLFNMQWQSSQSSYFSRSISRKNLDGNIYSDLKQLNISGEIMAEANILFTQVFELPTRRTSGVSRKSLACACVFEAYKRLGEPRHFKDVVSVFNLKQKSALN